MYELVNFDRGDLNQDKTAISGTPAREEDFTLDPTGNWTDYVQKTSGTTVLDQDRDHNKANEIDTDEVHGDGDNPITETTGTAWADPVHDAAGNMTTVLKSASLANGFTLKYDAWNRLVEVRDGGNLAARYEYDGLNRQTIEAPTYGPTTYYMHKFYNSSWQMLELRSTTTQNAQPELSSVSFQYVWSARYVDAPVLRGQLPSRQWLICAHAPRGRCGNVKITVPDYRAVSLDVSVVGSFYLVDEKLGSVTRVE